MPSRRERPRAVPAPRALDVDALSEAIRGCLATTPGGVAVRGLGRAVAARLGTHFAAVDQDQLDVALGLLIARGEVDEHAGRLVLVSREQRQAG